MGDVAFTPKMYKPPINSAFYTRGNYQFMSYTSAFQEQQRLEKRGVKSRLVPGKEKDIWELEIR